MLDLQNSVVLSLKFKSKIYWEILVIRSLKFQSLYSTLSIFVPIRRLLLRQKGSNVQLNNFRKDLPLQRISGDFFLCQQSTQIHILAQSLLLAPYWISFTHYFLEILAFSSVHSYSIRKHSIICTSNWAYIGKKIYVFTLANTTALNSVPGWRFSILKTGSRLLWWLSVRLSRADSWLPGRLWWGPQRI